MEMVQMGWKKSKPAMNERAETPANKRPHTQLAVKERPFRAALASQ